MVVTLRRLTCRSARRSLIAVLLDPRKWMVLPCSQLRYLSHPRVVLRLCCRMLIVVCRWQSVSCIISSSLFFVQILLRSSRRRRSSRPVFSGAGTRTSSGIRQPLSRGDFGVGSIGHGSSSSRSSSTCASRYQITPSGQMNP